MINTYHTQKMFHPILKRFNYKEIFLSCPLLPNKKSKKWTNFVIGAKVKTPHFQWRLNYKWTLAWRVDIPCFIGLAVGDSLEDCVSENALLQSCSFVYRPVCGSSQTQNKVETFSNKCSLDIRVLCEGEDWKIINYGVCQRRHGKK
ncbi:unnamed protein product [Nezara viridula]|uniref:Uncharacterized protein n=1 Tax=Nezara viridula TaxID=85310 RepID=A0A9P0HRR7_NEZVI|nr:unnamed protein product [Nezara viridula]